MVVAEPPEIVMVWARSLAPLAIVTPCGREILAPERQARARAPSPPRDVARVEGYRALLLPRVPAALIAANRPPGAPRSESGP
jgi:hypothetical protein